MSYGILLWGKGADINTIFVLQKRAIRSIYKLGSRDSLRELFKEIGILTIASQYILANILHVHKNIEKYVKNSQVHNYNTRNKNKLITGAFRLQKTSNSFLGLGIRLYNKIPANITALPFPKFKEFTKYMLSKRAYYNVSDYLADKNAWSLDSCEIQDFSKKFLLPICK